MKKTTFLVLLISILAPLSTLTAQYCTSSGSAGSGAFIGQSCFDFPNCETSNGPGSYSNRTGEGSKATYTPTGTNQLLGGVERSNAGDYTYAFYIDLNGDGDFTDTGETITTGSGNISFASGGLASINTTVTIPNSATNGTTRVRLIAKNGTTPVSGPCETGFNGETEDFLVTISGAGASTPPTAAFSAAPTSGCSIPHTVFFTDQSTDSPTAWSWDFGDGNTSTAQNPVHSYTTAGVYTVTLTASNSGGNDSTTETVRISSPINASISSQTNVSCNGGSNGSATATAGGGISPYSYSWAPSGGNNATATGLSAGSYTVTITDDNGCTDTANVTITEPAALVASASVNSNVSCNGGSDGSATVSVSGGASPYSYSWAPSGGNNATATGLSAGSYTVTITDDNGCTDTANVIITEPAVLNATITASTNASCPGSSDGSATVSVSGGALPYSYSWSPSGGSNATATGLSADTYTVTVTDGNGCTDTANVTITDTDTIPPVANCSVGNDIIVNGSFESGNFTGWTVEDFTMPFIPFYVGASNTGLGIFPEATPTDGTLMAANGFDANSGPDEAVIYQDITITSNNNLLTWDENIDYDLQSFCSGCSNRIYEVQIRDLSNNVLEVVNQVTAISGVIDNDNVWDSLSADLSAYIGQTIRIAFWQQVPDPSSGPAKFALDNVSLAANSFSVFLDANGEASITVADVDGGSTDNCGIASTSIDVTDFDCSNLGENTVTLTVTDTSGNTSTCTTTVTVEDNIAPVANCIAPFTVQLDANGQASITAADINDGSTDNCSIDTTSIDVTDFDCSNIGDNTVTLTVTDTSGNSSTRTTTVTVEDNVAPVANCAAPFTVQLDANGEASITAADVENGSTDACGVDTTTIDVTDFDCSNVGDNTVTLTVTDVNGNSSTCTTIVTVEDNIAPTITCTMDTMANTDPGDCYATVSFPNALASDNCSGVTVIQTEGLPSGSQFPVGVSTIEFTATDASGNTSVCSFDITVEDNEAPIAVCENITIQLDEFGSASITATDLDGGSTDVCGIDTVAIDQDTFDCSTVGDNNVTLTVTDINGNVSTCTAIVTVEDITAPEVVCQDITVQLDASGTVSITGMDVDGGSTDACGIASYDLDIDTFDCSNVGANAVELTVTDVNGNTATCTAMVTVEDNIAPDLVCADFTLELGEDGTATLLPGDVIASNDDACGIDTTAVDITEFDCSDIGTPVTVQVFVNDINGNLSTCYAMVTVIDTLAPVVTCPADQNVIAASSGTYTLPDYFATSEASAIDNCTSDVTIISQEPAAGTLLNEGVYTVTLTAEDDNGNIGTCTFELTVDPELGVGGTDTLGTVQLYPNPANNQVTIGNPLQNNLKEAVIYDLTGRVIRTINLNGMGAEKTIDITNLASATYLVRISSENGAITKQLIRE